MAGKEIATGELMGETHAGSKSVLDDLLCGAQVFYVSNIYPETITQKEAEEVEEWVNLPETDKHYWIAAAKVLIRLAT